MRTYASPLKDSDGRVVSHIAVTHKISAEKKKEEELRIALERAEAASIAKSQFLANMSHEIRTPINAVVGLTDLLLETALNPDQRELATDVLYSAQGLIQIINEILDFSKLRAGKVTIQKAPANFRFVLLG